MLKNSTKIMQLKIHQIEAALKEKNVRTELREDGYFIKLGFCLPNRHTWHWIRQHVELDFYLFDESYSQLTGSSKKGFRQSTKVYSTIKRLTNVSDV